MKDAENGENILKKLANDAKYRMKHCSYKNKQENMNIKRSMSFENHIRMIQESECKTPEITIKVINDYAEEENFQNRVIKLLKENEDCSNPMGELADGNLLSLMSEAEKQKYIFDLADKYIRVRDNYYKSKRAYL